MKSTKELVRECHYCDGVLTNLLERKRSVFRPKNGAPYVRSWKGKQALKTDADGVLLLETHSRTIQAISGSELLQMISDVSKQRP